MNLSNDLYKKNEKRFWFYILNFDKFAIVVFIKHTKCVNCIAEESDTKINPDQIGIYCCSRLLYFSISTFSSRLIPPGLQPGSPSGISMPCFVKCSTQTRKNSSESGSL